MALPKGRTNNPNGRPKGKPNRSTDDLRKTIQQAIDKSMDTLVADLESLTPDKRLENVARLAQFVLPKKLEHDMQGLATMAVIVEAGDFSQMKNWEEFLGKDSEQLKKADKPSTPKKE